MELETPVAPPAEPVAPPVAPPEPVTPPEPEPEGTVEVSGQRLAPVSAVIEERKAKQAAQAKIAEYQQAIAQVQPYIDFLRNNPNLMQPKAEPAPAAPVEDEAAVQLARMLDLYTPEGKPDTARAVLIRKTMRQEAREEAQSLVKPVQEGSLRDRSGAMYQRALVTKAPNGQGPDPNILARLWQQTDPSITATEEGAAGVVALAIGLSALTAGAPAPQPPANPPLVTEAPGGRFTATGKSGPLDGKIMEMRGLDQKTYAERVRGFNPGMTNVIEE